MVKKYWAMLTIGLIVTLAFPGFLRAGQASALSTGTVVAEVAQRVKTDGLQVRVYQGDQIVELTNFVELLVITPRGSRQTIENLAKRSVAIVRSEKNPDRWEVYQDVWAGVGEELTLADNVFKVKQVFVSSPKSLIELRIDRTSQLTTDPRKPHAREIIRLNPGDALLVL